VLVVDDEETVRDATQQLLRHLGFAVLTADDGRQAVEIYAAHADEIVLVLLDLTMPHMSGEDAYRELRAVNPAVRVVLASGYSETDLAERFAGRGLAGVLQKPYTLATLREVLARVLPPA
jgi:CheY-like chemotaxis protein